jgi:phenylalanyl-tRNA synthetase beta chain
MKVSLSWLQDYVTVDMRADTLADALTMAGLEVEALEDRYAYLDTVLVGRITAVTAHPKADRLHLCTVATGNLTCTVVCGAPNARVDLLAPLALPGSELPNGSKVAVGTIRGQRSQGMLCSEMELGLGADASKLMELDATLIPGTPLNKALGLSDAVLEISLTPNRPDCLSIMGIAREVAGLTDTKIRRPVIKLPQGSGDINTYTSVVVEAPEHCPRYSARLVDNLKVKPSPFWLQDRLMSVGLRPINNLVDITNYVMLETGQPLHAFDFDRLAENRIVVRTAYHDEPFVTLDGKQRRLEDDMLMICDGKTSVGVGGVMGGLNSEIQDDTQRVLIESAHFNPISIRKTAKRLGLNTDASHRFERGVDPQGTVFALNRAAQLMVELGEGHLISGTIDIQANLPAAPAIALSVAATNRLLGTDLDGDTIIALLEAIEFHVVEKNGDLLQVKTPSFRMDVSRPEDLMEEVARLHGYNNIPVTFPAMPSVRPPAAKIQVQRRHIRTLMKGFGFTETITYSFIHKASCDRLGLDNDDVRRRQIEVLNPLSEDQTVMRTSLVPGLLEAAQRNLSRQSRTLKLYETGRVFIGRDKQQLPEEIEMLTGCWTGNRHEMGWYAKPAACDFFDLKGVVEGLLAGLRIPDVRFSSLPDEQCRYTLPGATAIIASGSTQLGIIGQLHPHVLNAYALKQDVFLFEIDLPRLIERIPDTISAQPLPKFPSTSRDATLIIDREIESGILLDRIRQMNEPLVEDVRLFDLFEGNPVPRGRKSISLRVTYRSSETTLEDDAVNHLHKQISDRLVAQFNADLPT